MIPTTDTSKCDAAWIAIDPQPHPTSSRRTPGSSCQPELAADEVVLRGLSVGEVGLTLGEARARVRHRRTEDEPVEVVADVVVVCDGGGVPTHGVPSAVEPSLLRR